MSEVREHWVVNTHPKNREFMIEFTDPISRKPMIVRVPNTFAPLDLSRQADPDVLVRSANYRKALDMPQPYLKEITAEEARAMLEVPNCQEEYDRIRMNGWSTVSKQPIGMDEDDGEDYDVSSPRGDADGGIGADEALKEDQLFVRLFAPDNKEENIVREIMSLRNRGQLSKQFIERVRTEARNRKMDSVMEATGLRKKKKTAPESEKEAA